MLRKIPNKDKVVIVGGSFGRDDARHFKSTDASIWCVARIYDKVPYANFVFDMHKDGDLWTHRTFKAYEDKKLVVQHYEPEFPMAYVLPSDELIEMFGTVFTSSFSWMTALAIYHGVKKISFYGVNMIHETEMGAPRDGLLYLLGYAKARGIKIDAPQRSYLRYGVRL